MTIRKKFKKYALIILLLSFAIIFYYLWVSLPIISGYSAKNMCSCIFVAHRDQKSISNEELNFFPVSMTNISVNYADSSVTGSVLGLAVQKAIYRPGLGCTLINDYSEKQLRSQVYKLVPALSTDPETIDWPMGERTNLKAAINENYPKLKNVVNDGFSEPDPKHPVKTRAVIILYNGELVYEQYAPGFDRHSRMMGWSMTKSVIGALIGILVEKGKLSVTDRAPVPEWENVNDSRHAITIEHLLQQSTGLEFEENYDRTSEVTNMLFKKGDMGRYAASLPLKYPPGTVFSYSSGNSNILSRVIRGSVPEEDYYSFPQRELFHKSGMSSVIMEPDASGTFVGSSYMYATARDWARFGLIYYNDGICNNERILPEGWVKKTVEPAPHDLRRQYGYQWWLNAGPVSNLMARPYPDVPNDMYYADGYEGQNIFIIPSRKLVVVRLGLTHKTSFDGNHFLAAILNAFPQ